MRLRLQVQLAVSTTVLIAPSAHAAVNCLPSGATFVAKSAQAELYSVAPKGNGPVKRKYFGCVPGAKPVLLTQDVVPKSSQDTAYANSTFRLGGTWAAWVETTASDSGVGEFTRAIHVRSLAGAKRQVQVFTTTDVAGFGDVADLKAGSDGAVAFMLTTSGAVTEVDGVAKDAVLPVALAYGTGIDRKSLHLGGGKVSFRQNGKTQALPLLEPAAVPTGNAAGPQGLDGRFGDCGTLVPAAVKPNIDTAATRLGQAPDGSILAAGTTTSGKGNPVHADRIVVARFSPAGKLDQGFGSGGAAILTAPRPANGGDVYVGGLVVQPDGKVVVAENAEGESPAQTEVVLLRFDTAGKLDPTFGTAGVVRAAVVAKTSADVNRLALAPDGGLVAAGARGGRWYVARFGADGKPDSGFGVAGLVTDPGKVSSAANALDVAPDGTIVAGGGTGGVPLLLRLSPTGTVLSATTDAPAAGASIFALRRMADGSYAAAGAASNIEGVNQMLLAHYGADGSLDRAFGSGGFTIDREVDAARDVAVAGDGRWLVTAPFSFSGDGVIGYTANGVRDGGFGFRGAIGGITSYGMTDNDILLGADGTAYVAQANGLAFAVSRFAIGEPAVGATAKEPSVCAMLVAVKLKPSQIAAGRKLGVGMRLRKPGRVHLRATATVSGKTFVLGSTTFSRSEDEAAVAQIPVTRAAAQRLRGAKQAKITITGGAPGGATRRYSIMLSG
jgi:uncharacterized delta-60 repeat protein